MSAMCFKIFGCNSVNHAVHYCTNRMVSKEIETSDDLLPAALGVPLLLINACLSKVFSPLLRRGPHTEQLAQRADHKPGSGAI